MIVPNSFWCGDCLELMRGIPDDTFDLVLCSPPYEAQREYEELKFNLRGEDWVRWAFERYMECVRICKGLVVWVAEGQTKHARWSATPILLAADLSRAGVCLRKPTIYHRVGAPGNRADWLRNDYEFCICSTKGRLPWSNPLACGKPPKYDPGGVPSFRKADGSRIEPKARRIRQANGEIEIQHGYKQPEIVNPGNVVREVDEDEGEIAGDVIKCSVGGAHMGAMQGHINEAAFPLKLAEFFVKSFCPPDGLVLDCFSGSGTTADAARRHGRNYIGIDLRPSQIILATERLQLIAFNQGSPVKNYGNKKKKPLSGQKSLFDGSPRVD